MTFEEILDQVLAMLQRRGRVSYRALMRQFALDEAYLEDLKEAILFAHPQAIDEAGRGLVWSGDTGAIPAVPDAPEPVGQPVMLTPRSDQTAVPSPEPYTPDAERRQLTVLFCDLVDSTPLASRLDPEDLREVVRAYQETCAKVVARFEGHIAQYLGDGLLVYFGYPLAHEDDAQRAVRAGLGMVEALGQLNTRLRDERGVHLAVRLGIHTGLVVVGDVGGGTRQEQLALGETPNLAARLQGLAAPNTLVISAATLQLLRGFFACQSLGTPLLRGFAQPLEVYQVLSESTARSRLDVADSTGLTPLVGREQEVGLLLERWTQVKDGLGQVVLLSGEAGIGKSRLVQALKEQVAAEPQAWLTPCQCSPYYQNTALYPLIDLLERVALHFEREESPQHKLRKPEGLVVQYGLPLGEAVPLLAALLSLPLDSGYTPLPVSPEQHKQQTLQTLLTILLRIAAQQPVLFVMEDLHWVDPTTLEFLSLLVDQGPTTRILALWTFRPDFSPPWTGRAHLTQVTLPRLPRRQAVEMTSRVAHNKALPPEVVEQVVAKTDGVPLFVEELTKMVLESGLLQEQAERTYARACELARQVGSTPELFPALWGFWYAHMARGQLPRVRELAEEFLGLARQQQDPLLLATGHRMLGNTAWWQGELVQAQVHCRQGLAFYDPAQHRASAVSYGQDSGVNCGILGALTLWMLGYPDQALQGMEETLALAHRLAHPMSLAQALHFSAHLHQLRREPQGARAQAEAALALCTEQGFAPYGAWSLLPRGWALAQQGEVTEGIAQIRQGFAAWRAIGMGVAWPWWLALLAEACGKVGQLDEALRAVEEALAAVQNNEEHHYEAEVCRLKGELLLQDSPAHQAEAEEHFQQAIDIARRRQAKSWELRAAMSLSHLWQQQDKREEARQLLAEVYGWFTEGFDTADLREARGLLEALS